VDFFRDIAAHAAQFTNLSHITVSGSSIDFVRRFSQIQRLSLLRYSSITCKEILDTVAQHPNIEWLDLEKVTFWEELVTQVHGFLSHNVFDDNKYPLPYIPLKTIRLMSSSNGIVKVLVEGFQSYDPSFRLDRLILSNISEEMAESILYTLDRLGDQLGNLELDFSTMTYSWQVDGKSILIATDSL